MEKVRIDLIVNGRKETLDGVVNIRTVDHAIWQIDKEPGKKLCLIEVSIPQKGITLNFPPSDDLYEALIDKMLGVEYQNNSFKYTNPVKGPRRPRQLEIKIQRLLKILNRWAKRGIQLSIFNSKESL